MRGAREAPAPRDSLNFRQVSLLSRNEFESTTFTIVLHATSSFTYVSVIYGANFPFKPLVSSLPSYIRDTKYLLSQLQALPPLPPGALLFTMDVTALYTNIPHKAGLAACAHVLDSRPNQVPLHDRRHHLPCAFGVGTQRVYFFFFFSSQIFFF